VPTGRDARRISRDCMVDLPNVNDGSLGAGELPGKAGM
jgi:hypothetical protein